MLHRPESQLDEGETTLRVVFAAQVFGRFDKHDFECRPHAGLDQMTAARRGVGSAEHHMGVDFRLALLGERDVAHQRQHFHLFAHGDFVVVLFLQVEVTQRRLLETADGREVARGQFLFAGKSGQAGNRFVAGGKDQDESFFALMLVDQLRFHPLLPSLRVLAQKY